MHDHDDKDTSRQVAEAEAKRLLDELGATQWNALSAAAQLYRNGIQLGEPAWRQDGPGVIMELGVKNDGQGSMELLDQVLQPFVTQKSCGLARLVFCADTAQWLEVTRRVGLVLVAGSLAMRAGETARRMH